MLIALEGIDGAGTTTQTERLAAYFEEHGISCHRTAEPSTGPIGLLIRQVLRRELTMDETALALLFAADRLDHLQREIVPALRAGKLVLTDRYLLSSLAYQSLATPLAFVRQINAHATLPDVSLLLRLPARTAAERRELRGGPTEHFDALAQQEKIAKAYDRVAALDDVGDVEVIDASAPVATVTETIVARLAPRLAARKISVSHDSPRR